MAHGNCNRRPSNFQDMTGRRFGHLVFRKYAGSRNGKCYWELLCDCGNSCTAAASEVRRGRKRSCNCQKKVLFREAYQKSAERRIVRLNRERISDDGQVRLPGGSVCIVDSSDVPLIRQHLWSKQGKPGNEYARCSGLRLMMHNLIMGRRDGFLVDHKNGNGLDNRRCNLRWATRSENASNIKKPARGRSRFRGVSGGWVAQISKAGGGFRETRIIGVFRTEEEAARAYDREAVKRWGRFATLNFPEEHNGD